MDDRELEARLRVRLHQRFDGAEPPATLRPVVADVGASHLRALPRSVSIAWLAVATLIVAVVAGLGIRGASGPGGQAPSPTAPGQTGSPGPSSRQYIVLPPSGSNPSKASTTLAGDALSLRLRAIGIGNFSSGGGYALTYQLPGDVDDALVRAVLGATGELSFVPLPTADYGPGKAEAVIGQALSVAEPALFGSDQVSSAGVGTSNGSPATVHFELRQAAADALETFTSAQLGETLAVLVDGKVATLSPIPTPIPSGRLEITATNARDLLFLAAIVTSGTLPEDWRAPSVPKVIPESEARSLAVAAAASPDAVVVSAELSTFDALGGVGHGLSFVIIPAWIVKLSGTLPDRSCTSSPLQSPVPPPCPAVGTGQVVLDAVTGEALQTTF